MTSVSLKKVDRYEAASLQEMVKVYSDAIEEKINPQMSLQFYDHMHEVDILTELWFALRKKIEGRPKCFTLSLKVSHAVILIYAMSHCKTTDNDYAKTVISKYCSAIDNDLKNRILIKPSVRQSQASLIQASKQHFIAQ